MKISVKNLYVFQSDCLTVFSYFLKEKIALLCPLKIRFFDSIYGSSIEIYN